MTRRVSSKPAKLTNLMGRNRLVSTVGVVLFKIPANVACQGAEMEHAYKKLVLREAVVSEILQTTYLRIHADRESSPGMAKILVVVTDLKASSFSVSSISIRLMERYDEIKLAGLKGSALRMSMCNEQGSNLCFRPGYPNPLL